MIHVSTSKVLDILMTYLDLSDPGVQNFQRIPIDGHLLTLRSDAVLNQPL